MHSAKRPIGSLAAFVLIVGMSPSAASADEETAPPSTQDYAAYFGVDLQTAAREMELSDLAGSIEPKLLAVDGSHYTGVWIQHEPVFKVVVGTTADNDDQIRDSVDPALSDVLDVRHQQYSMDELLQGIAELKVLEGVEHSYQIDVVTNRIVVNVLQSLAEKAREALESADDPGMFEVAIVNGLPTEVASIYGGVSLDATDGGLSGTAGFTVHKQGVGTGVVTAGHLSNNLRWTASYPLTFKAGQTSGNADAQWHTTPGLTDTPGKIRCRASGQICWMHDYRSYFYISSGLFLCKYGRTTGYDCGTVETKTLDPDGFFGPLNSVFVQVANCQNNGDLAFEGDSGGPVFVNDLAFGIMTHRTSGDPFCGPKKMIFNSITHFSSVLGIGVMFDSTH